MPIMEWSDDLDVGVQAMNHEHQQILNLMNKIHDASQAGQSGPPIIALVDQLANVTVAHFRDEEAYMEKIGFPGLGPHKIIHQDLLKRYGEYAVEIKRDHGRVPQKFLTFLKLWLTAHIRGIDMKYGPKHMSAMKKAG